MAVIRQRLDAMMGEIGRTLKDLHFVGPVGRQVVLVGGGADLKGIADYTQSALAARRASGDRAGCTACPMCTAAPLSRRSRVWFSMPRRTRWTSAICR